MVDLIQALTYIEPSVLEYNEWLEIGMGLKSAANDGYEISWTDWDEWSKRDPARYQEGVCEKKWHSFNSSGITKATIVYRAMQNGFEPLKETVGLDWFDEIDDGRPPQEDKDFEIYIKTLFDKEDLVSFVINSEKNDKGKYNPVDSGIYGIQAKKLIQDFRRYHNDIESVIGDYNHEAGAWIRINPMDGKGVRNSNVARFKYTLVESDQTDLETQLETIYKLRLPCAAIVHSGGKSIHAIVKVEAEDYEEYKQRVLYIHRVLKKQNFPLDEADKNPSRLSRIPGVERGKEKQFLIDIHTGYNSFSAWQEFVENDFREIELPEIVTLSELLKNPPELRPELIEGVLRQGHKLLLSGSSKAGKSFFLIELGLALSQGYDFLGWKCLKSKVLYINLEIDEASFGARVLNVLKANGEETNLPDNFTMLHLRGKAQPMHRLTPKLIKRIQPENYDVIILDPVYKVQSGDENAAGDIARFTNEFDKLTTELGVSMIYCHHHSKGNQGGKRAIDRASGSGVFARDPDAILDLIELDNKTYQFDQKYKNCSAWRIEGTLREFPPIEPINIFFKHPIHELDQKGLLKNAEYKNYAEIERKTKTIEDTLNELDDCFNMLSDDNDWVNEADMAKFFEVTTETMRKKIGTYNRLSKDYIYRRRNGKIYRDKK